MNEPTPGYKSTEGAAALVGIGGPLLTALLARDLTWQQLVALGIVGFVACVYIVSRTWLKRAGVPVAMLAVLLLSLPAHADGPQLRAPMPPDVPAVPVVAPEPAPPPVLTLSGFAACSAKAAADCLANPTAPPADQRAFYTSLLAGTIPPLVNLAAILWLKLDPSPIGK